MKIQDVICSAGLTGFFFDDQKAIKAGAAHDGFFYAGEPKTPGFAAIRQPGQSISIMLRLDNGQYACGDCAAVQYSGAGGRDPLFAAEQFLPMIRTHIAPLLVGQETQSFRALTDRLEQVRCGDRPLHTAIRYGLSQAVLDAVARARNLLPAEVLAEEYGCPLRLAPVPIFAQSGDERYTNVDKMILKQADVLPHALINNIPDKLGEDGAKLLEYVQWLRERITTRRLDPRYQPQLHIDVYGTIGMIFANDTGRMAAYLGRLGEAARPFALRIEGPMDMGQREAQCEALATLCRRLRAGGIDVGVVADEWCNTLEDVRLFADAGAGDMLQIKTPDLGGIQNSAQAVLYCRQKGVGAYLGGTCNETDRSAQMCVHVALATRPDQMLAKPGMGVDEGFMIVFNEMRRTLAILAARQGQAR